MKDIVKYSYYRTGGWYQVRGLRNHRSRDMSKKMEKIQKTKKFQKRRKDYIADEMYN